MTSTRTAETRVVTLNVTDAEDVTTYLGRTSVIPQTVEVTYKWMSPETRPDWFKPGWSGAKVTGVKRLKSGAAGQQEISVEFWPGAHTREAPGWLVALIDEHMPSDLSACRCLAGSCDLADCRTRHPTRPTRSTP